MLTLLNGHILNFSSNIDRNKELFVRCARMRNAPSHVRVMKKSLKAEQFSSPNFFHISDIFSIKWNFSVLIAFLRLKRKLRVRLENSLK